jgi:hypothetical protein
MIDPNPSAVGRYETLFAPFTQKRFSGIQPLD